MDWRQVLYDNNTEETRENHLTSPLKKNSVNSDLKGDQDSAGRLKHITKMTQNTLQINPSMQKDIQNGCPADYEVMKLYSCLDSDSHMWYKKDLMHT